ncbi:polysaccharide lyase 6 family protein [Reinekea marinisedimentorum]|uniref:F5/8 type C domain-containing protein n=1 Tax=Reinekea marinisedimentorum TaxID=230495 RepID=A0A4R3HSC4_9GAMM|nr:polysaccharide lyase 6 family protein [Reinekea marinisedimentorum]TCS35902.1 F5/8 type C domain-containing protein [Reinekea marinisedimentorum]
MSLKKVSVLATLVAAVSAANAATVSIDDASFENGWGSWVSSSASLTDNDAYDGDYAADISTSGSRFEQTVSVDANTSYTLTAQIMGSGVIGADVGAVEYSQSLTADMDDWIEVSVQIESGSETEITLFGAYNDDEGLVDYVTLESTGESTAGETEETVDEADDTTDDSEDSDDSTEACSAIDMSVVESTSSYDSIYEPGNTIDNVTTDESRWSSDENGAYITYSLADVYSLSSIDIFWYKGDSRSSYFDVSVSSDNSSWTDVISGGSSSGSSTGFEAFDLSDAEGEYVRITGYGNSANAWNSIIEVDVNGCLSDDNADDDEPEEDLPVTEEPVEDDSEEEDSGEEDSGTIGSGSTESNFTRGSLGDNDTVPTIACDTTVSSTSALEDAVSETMEAGTTICLANGEYTDLELQFGGVGSSSAPIKVAAETSGGVTIGGTVLVRMGGEYVQLQGFIFKDGLSDGDLIQTRLGSDPAEFCYNCRITEISVIDMDEDATDSNRWVHLYGEYNRVDHSYFSGKSNAGSLMTVSRELSDYVTDAAGSYGNYMTIDHNYFGDRPPADGKAYAESSDNEYEAIRIGTSETHESDSNSVVEYNYLEKIQGEAEVISNKSGNNTIRFNTIRDSYGSLTTRHGSSITIEGNVIIGDDHPYAGGIRIVDDGHSVFNNYIEGARYKDTTHHGGIVLMGSTVSATGSTSSGYQYLTNVMVANNTIVDSVNSLNVDGGSKSYNPDSVYLVNNLIQDGIGAVITQSDDGMPENSTIEGNIFFGQSYADSDTLADDSVYGITWWDAELEQDSQGLYRPTDSSSANLEVDAYSNSSFESIDDDMDGQSRSSVTLAGADEIATSAASIGLLNRYDVGPMTYTPEATEPHVAEVEIDNYDFDNGSTGWNLADAYISEDSTVVFSRGSSAYIDVAGGIISQEVSIEANTNYTLTAFVNGEATLGAEVDGIDYTTATSASDYELATVSFNSGSATSITVYGTAVGSAAAFDSFRLVSHETLY